LTSPLNLSRLAVLRENILQQQHALQCVHLAELASASPELVVATLLHDLGHLLEVDTLLLAPVKVTLVDCAQQYVAIPTLRGLFPDAVLELIYLLVEVKRYL
jgi:predicted HD phosphohydrolase